MSIRAMAVAAAVLCVTHPAVAQEGRESTGRFDYWLPVNVFPESKTIDMLFYVILAMTTVACVGVFAVLGAFLWMYRYKPGRKAIFVHGNNSLELAWTLIPTVILALTAAVAQSAWTDMKFAPKAPTQAEIQNHEKLQVRVVGLQFKWYTQYPGPDGKLGELDFAKAKKGTAEDLVGLQRTGDGADDVVIDALVVPVDTEVHVELVSKDVLHSFFLPNFRVKQDAVPGLRGEVWFRADRTSAEVIGRDPETPLFFYHHETYQRVVVTTGKPFDIVCAELCGPNHYTMRGRLYAVTRDEYMQFINAVYPEAKEQGEGDGAGTAEDEFG